ncbi:umecyanin-like [Lycium barbarum]|uniref:umecyanin-like n=1 Tax=Lycium barbarum TaxID=112863 RepID=UPI00293E19BF|nr:umecyanin-like [Lycium barbarum]
MDKVMRMVVVGALAIATLLQVTTAQTVHVVGEDTAWTIPVSGSVVYTTWASKNTFKVGDTLVFNFATSRHDVQEVAKASFEECNTKNVIGKSITTGPANVTLESPGEHYYICTVGKHCLAGQKLAITVSGTSNAPRPSSSSSTVVFASFLLSLSSIALAIFI